jgi:hypothetical protein
MKTLLLLLLCAALTCAGEIDIELVTGSRFPGTLKSVTARMVVVDTAIGELKLTPSMLSPACRRRVAEAARAGTSDAPLPDLGIKVSYRIKTVEREKDSFRGGGSREMRRRSGVLTVEFETPPRDRKVIGYIEYAFTGEVRSVQDRGDVREFDQGREEFVLDPTKSTTPVEIVSKPLTHLEAGHTGDLVGESGAEPKGYSIKVVVDGRIVHEESK